MTKYELYKEDRERGLTYQAIADKYGVSRQAIHCVCTRVRSKRPFVPYTEKQVIYPALRAWLNEKKMKRIEILRTVNPKAEYGGSDYIMISNVLSGKIGMSKKYIDLLITATGMTYEEMFAAG